MHLIANDRGSEHDEDDTVVVDGHLACLTAFYKSRFVIDISFLINF